jgi:hypothetical protein
VLARSQRVAAITGMLREAEPTGKEALLRQCRKRDTRAALAQTGEAHGRVRCAATMRRGSAAVCRRERRSGSLPDYCDKVAKGRRLRSSRRSRRVRRATQRVRALYPVPHTDNMQTQRPSATRGDRAASARTRPSRTTSHRTPRRLCAAAERRARPAAGV